MDRKKLKEAGKRLFKKEYWYSVIVAFLMGLAGASSAGFSLNLDSSSSQDASSFEAVFNSSAELKEFLLELIQRPFAAAFIGAISVSLIISLVLHYLVFNSFRCGGIRYFLKSRKNQPAEIGEVFQNFKDKTNFNIAKVTLLKDIPIVLWTFVFAIPGIIKGLEYWAVEYILAVRPDIDEKEAKRLSKAIMKGNKWDCFILELSFIGWHLLSAFTFGLLNVFYINPYMQATYVEFFSDVRNQALAKGVITPADIPDYEMYNPFYQSPFDMSQNQGFTPPTYQQTWNNPYAPQGNPVNNNFYAPQQPIAQPIEPVVDAPVEEPVENVVEPVAEPIIEATEPTTEDPNE